jgi:hypothetical protein
MDEIMRIFTTGPVALLLALAACGAETSNSPAGLDDVTILEAKIGDQGGRPLSTSLSGAEEVPPVPTPGTGTFVATLNQGQGQICYELTVSDLLHPVRPAGGGAHIHRAPAGTNGGVVVPLIAPVDGASSGCATVSRELIKEIRQNPENFYVNVHTLGYPGGEVRGQLSK